MELGPEMGEPWMSYLHLIMLPGVTSALTIHLFDYFTLSKHEIGENQNQNLSGQHPWVLCKHTSGSVCDGFRQGYLICCFMEHLGHGAHGPGTLNFLLCLGIPLLLQWWFFPAVVAVATWIALQQERPSPFCFYLLGSKGFSFPKAPQM